MNRVTQIHLMDLNQHIICALCGGYFIDATTIIECLHSFCRACIVRYLESSKCCPICDVQVHKTRPTVNLRADKTLQDLVYKLVPGLFQNEMKRRREFFAKHPQAGTSTSSVNPGEERGEVEARSLPRDDEKMSLCLQHTRCLPPFRNDNAFGEQLAGDDLDKSNDRRYLLCPAELTVGHLKKFLRLKFDLLPQFQVEMFHSDESLREDYTLVDIACIYGWRRQSPLKLFYIVYDKTTTTLKLPNLCKELPISDHPPPQRKKPIRKPKVKDKDSSEPIAGDLSAERKREGSKPKKVKKNTKGVKRSKKKGNTIAKETLASPSAVTSSVSSGVGQSEDAKRPDCVQKPEDVETPGVPCRPTPKSVTVVVPEKEAVPSMKINGDASNKELNDVTDGTNVAGVKNKNDLSSSVDKREHVTSGETASKHSQKADETESGNNRSSKSKDINDNHGEKTTSESGEGFQNGVDDCRSSVVRPEESSQNGLATKPRLSQKAVNGYTTDDDVSEKSQLETPGGGKRVTISPCQNGALSHIESLVNSMKMSRERHESVNGNGSGGDSSPESRRDSSFENGGLTNGASSSAYHKSRKRKQAQPLKHERSKNGLTSPCPAGKLPKMEVADDISANSARQMNGHTNGLTHSHNKSVTNHGTKHAPSNTLITNGLDKPLELSTKKKRSREREKEREKRPS